MQFLALLAIVLAAVWLQNLLFSKLSFKSLDYRCAFSTDEAAEGDEIELVETIENRKWLPVPWLKSEITTSRWLDFAGAQSVVTDKTRFVPSFFMVRGYQRVERKWKVRCLKRGVFAVDRIELVATDLFGNLSLSRGADASGTLAVLPRADVWDTALMPPRYLFGDRVVPRHVVADPFYRCGVREYTGREAINRIHWPATAKEGRLMVYENEYTSRQNLCVILNVQSRAFENSAAVDEERVEDALRVCASVFVYCHRQGIPLRFIVNANTRPGRVPIITEEAWGAEFTHGLLCTLAGLVLTSTDDFPTFLGSLDGRVSASDILIVTAYVSASMAPFIHRQRLAGAHVRVALTGYAAGDEGETGCEVVRMDSTGGVRA